MKNHSVSKQLLEILHFEISVKYGLKFFLRIPTMSKLSNDNTIFSTSSPSCAKWKMNMDMCSPLFARTAGDGFFYKKLRNTVFGLHIDMTVYGTVVILLRD